MANNTLTRTIADADGFVPEVWANKALKLFRSKVVMAKLVSRDFEYEPGLQGQAITIGIPGAYTKQTKSEDTQISPAKPANGSKVRLQLDTFETVDTVIEDWAKVQSNPGLLDAQLEPMMTPLVNAVEDKLMALNAGFATSVGADGADITKDTLIEIGSTFDTAEVPGTRNFIMSVKDKAALLGTTDETLMRYMANSRPDIIETGLLAKELYGLVPYYSTRVPKVGAQTQCVAFTREAIVLAIRPFAETEDGLGVKYSQVVDEESGIALRFGRSYDVGHRGVRIWFDILYAAKELRDTCGILVKT